MLFARPPRPEPAWCDLAQIAREAVEPLRDRAGENGAVIELQAPSSVAVFADPLQIAVVITALVENAITAAREGGRIRLSVAEQDEVPTLIVADDGCGFSDLDRQHAFDPFYSGRQAGRGLGFGLPKAWRIVTLAGGSINIGSRPGETAVRVRLPRPSPPTPHRSSRNGHSGRRSRG